MDFKTYLESKREIERQEVERAITHLGYQKGLAPSDVASMSSRELIPLVQYLKPTESWSNYRWSMMIKSMAREIAQGEQNA